MAKRKQVIIYTDGGCKPNPGPGGYGAVLLYGKHRKEISGGFRRTTNNRMEIYAAIAALEALLEPCTVVLHTDSQYLANAMGKGWVERWRRQRWMRNKTDPALNVDLWKRLLIMTERHEVTWKWTRGHAGNPHNERVDKLATKARKRLTGKS